METPEQALQRLSAMNVDGKSMAAGHYEIARAIIVLANEVGKLVSVFMSMRHQGSLLITKRGG